MPHVLLLALAILTFLSILCTYQATNLNNKTNYNGTVVLKVDTQISYLENLNLRVCLPHLSTNGLKKISVLCTSIYCLQVFSKVYANKII